MRQLPLKVSAIILLGFFLVPSATYGQQFGTAYTPYGEPYTYLIPAPNNGGQTNSYPNYPTGGNYSYASGVNYLPSPLYQTPYYSPQSPIASSLNVACTASPATAKVGETVLWYSSVTGGTGAYQYYWSGTDGLSGNTSSIQRAYSTPSPKYATITVVSGSQSVTVGCNTVLSVIPATFTPSLGISCYAAQEKIKPGEATTWVAVTSGASATTTYLWQGTDNLTGNTSAVVKTYPTTGKKQAIVTVTSGNQSLVSACTNTVQVGNTPIPAKPASISKPPTIAPETGAPLQGVCAPLVAESKPGRAVTWQATAIGGIGSYNFTWQGSEGLLGNGVTSAVSYNEVGMKNASVLITSGTQVVAVTCAPGVNVVSDDDSGLLAAGAISRWDDPILLFLLLLLALIICLLIVLYHCRRDDRNPQKDAGPIAPTIVPVVTHKQEEKHAERRAKIEHDKARIMPIYEVPMEHKEQVQPMI